MNEENKYFVPRRPFDIKYLNQDHPSLFNYLKNNNVKHINTYLYKLSYSLLNVIDFCCKKDWLSTIDMDKSVMFLSFYNYDNPNNDFYLLSCNIQFITLFSGNLKDKIQNHILLQ